MPDPSPLPEAARLERLLDASLAIASEHALEPVLQKVTEVGADLIGSRFAALGVLAPDGRTLEAFHTAGMDPDEVRRIGEHPKGHGILGLVIREGRPIRLPDLVRHPDSFGFPPHHPPMHSFLGVPISGRRGIFGNLYFTEKLGGGLFTDEDEHLALLLAAQAGVAVENARLHEEAGRLLGEVQQLQRRRERFFAMVNHELRNALAATYGWAEMLVRKRDPGSVPRAAYEVLDSCEQAIALINDLLDLSRLDEDRLRPDLKPVDPAAVARRAIARITPAAQAKGIRVTLDAPPRTPPCATDALRVEQILVNIPVNAVRHTPADGHVTVTLAMTPERGTFTVDDSGPGVPEAELERIFDIYETKPGEAHRGAGLGLPLSRRLARLLKGDLRAEHHEGGGGRFVLELPCQPIVK